ncbi:MAG: hypothetical protein EBY56_04270 [Actinobacteria bacterium]|nr:hypothetical protein [Actinomycetota bacterium]
MARIIAVANQKGGVAKTTTAITLAAALADTGHSVLVIDLDAQACATFSLGIDPEDLPPQTVDFLLDDLPSSEGSAQMRSAIRTTDEGFSLLPATLSLASADVSLADRPARERTLSRILDEIRDTFDVIVIDCSPSLGLTTINALVAADDVLVPFKCETLSHRGLGQLMESIGCFGVGM